MAAWGGRHSTRLRLLTLATYGTICHLCGRPDADTADHVVPRSKGGPDALDNLRPAHKTCNYSRRDLPLEEWFRLHPRAGPSPASREW